MSIVQVKKRGGVLVNPYDIYIGRRCTMGGHDLHQSIWANPYTVKEHGLERAIELYEVYMRERLVKEPELREQLRLLQGKTLGCFCKQPGPCHGHSIIRLMQEFC